MAFGLTNRSEPLPPGGFLFCHGRSSGCSSAVPAVACYILGVVATVAPAVGASTVPNGEVLRAHAENRTDEPPATGRGGGRQPQTVSGIQMISGRERRSIDRGPNRARRGQDVNPPMKGPAYADG